ncbi:hypothetical protein MPTK1_4g07660 [Marchantia polymorpha subsp. ruderalis]|uniref:Uncharacterized protein n=2 Tax=Marchantia polymorpha TaxID=3197 RepID=A0AAF6B7I2_MARPO|nr:hypothetical protein MARPO_0115s0015 [Marchantia polymorpha]BBN07966.1 hypothetical protein Mp_4g07660 [Marchantia polymorpha subsp. ruderalis]|eukprot:PTQ31088.1 hypothetical protein MARPO_0115s0015 [Marchantia polymorpha]
MRQVIHQSIASSCEATTEEDPLAPPLALFLIPGRDTRVLASVRFIRSRVPPSHCLS